MNVDLSGLEQALVSLAAAIVIAATPILVPRILKKLGLNIADQQEARLESAAIKAVTYGATVSQDTIKAKGWDHVDVKNQVLAEGLQYASDKFAGTLKASGISNDPAAITQVLERVYPEAMKRAAESPATPPATAPNPPTQSAVPIVQASETGTTPAVVPAPPVISKE